VNGNQPIFNEAVDLFNDYGLHSGGLITEHEEFVKRSIDTEQKNNSGLKLEYNIT
jgi:hypothetical protein